MQLPPTEKCRNDEHFLLSLIDALDALERPVLIGPEAARRLAQHLQVSDSYFLDDAAMESTSGRGVPASPPHPIHLQLLRAVSRQEWRGSSNSPISVADFGEWLTGDLVQQAAASGMASAAFAQVRAGEHYFGCFALTHATPRKWTGPESELIQESARRTALAIARAASATELRIRQSYHSFLLGLSDRTRTEVDAEQLISDTCGMLGDFLGVGRVVFGEVSASGNERTVTVRQWVNGTSDFPLTPRSWAEVNQPFRAAMEAGRPFRIDEVAAEPGQSEVPQAAWEEHLNASVLAVPHLRDGELLAFLLIADTSPRRWHDGEVALVEEVAIRTWSTLERALAEARLRLATANQAFLLQLADAIRGETDPKSILSITAQRVGRYLGVSRIVYSELNQNEDAFYSTHQWTNGVPPVPSTRLDDLDPAGVAALHSGSPLRVNDVGAVPHFVGADALNELGTRAFLCVPLIKRGIYVATLTATDHQVHHWCDSDEFLLSEVAERTWSTLQRARAEHELEQSRAALYQSEKLTALGSLLAGVSHELNNPLSVVVGQALIMEGKAGDQATAVRAGKIRAAAERCARIVQSFLAMARQREPERQPVDINDLLQAALDLTAYGLRSADVKVSTRFERELPIVFGDAGQLHQLFANLIINAQHALESQRGARELSIATSVAEDRVVVELHDSGPGVPADLRPRIFEPFFTTKPVGSGTGLGLSFAYGVSQAHGGTLSLVDTAVGALFRVELPARQSPEGPAPVEGDVPEIAAGTALVVDDEVDLAETLSELLEAEGWKVIIADSGARAIEILQEEDPQLIIADIKMPQVDGPGLYTWLQEHRPRLVERLVFLTGDTLGAAANAFLASCGRPFVEKPFSSATIATLLSTSSSGRNI